MPCRSHENKNVREALGATSNQGTHVNSNNIRVRILVALLSCATAFAAAQPGAALSHGDASPTLPPMLGGPLTKAAGEVAPADFDDGTGGGGQPPGGNVQQLARYLRMRVQQSYNQTFQDAYYILESGARTALHSMPNMPVAMEACLRGALRGAHDADSYKDAWRQLHATMKRLGHQPHAFTGYGYDRLRSCLSLVRESSWEQSFRNAYYLVRNYLDTLRSRPELFEGLELYRVAAESALASAQQADEYDDGWRMIDRSLMVLADSGHYAGASAYFRAALEGSYGNSFKNGYNCLMTWARRILPTGWIGEFERLELTSSIRAARRANSYDAGYRILRTSLQVMAAGNP
jgi:hypothetical protein